MWHLEKAALLRVHFYRPRQNSDKPWKAGYKTRWQKARNLDTQVICGKTDGEVRCRACEPEKICKETFEVKGDQFSVQEV